MANLQVAVPTASVVSEQWMAAPHGRPSPAATVFASWVAAGAFQPKTRVLQLLMHSLTAVALTGWASRNAPGSSVSREARRVLAWVSSVYLQG